MKTKLFFSLAFFTATTAAFAQALTSSGSSFSLKEAQDYAVQNNATSKNAAIDIRQGDARIMENIALGLPQINGEVGYNYNIAPPVFIFPNIAGPNPNPNEFIAIDAAPLNTMTASATASMLLVSGQYFVGISTAKTFLELTKQQKVKTDIDVREQVLKSYYMVLIAGESKIVLDSTLKTVERTLFETEQLYESGLIEELDVEQLRLVLYSTQDLALQTSRSFDLALYSLKFQMGYPVDKEIMLTDNLNALIESNDFASVVGGLSDTVDVRTNIDYRLISQKLMIDKYQVKLQRAEAYPTLSTFFQVSGNFFNNERIIFANGTTSTLGGVIWGVNLKVPIFSSWNRVSKLKRLNLEVKKTENTQALTEQGLRLTYKSSVTQINNDYQRFITSRKNFELAQKIRRVNDIKYREGLASSLELTQTQQQFFEAQQRYYQAMYELLNSRIQLDKVLNRF